MENAIEIFPQLKVSLRSSNALFKMKRNREQLQTNDQKKLLLEFTYRSVQQIRC